LSETTVTVTVLFTDIVGSTALKTSRGDSAAQDVLRSHFDLVRQQIRGHSGHEVKTIGDSFMVVFSSARRAVECAIAVQQALERQALSSTARVQVRIGLHTGEAIQESGDYFGSVVDAAERIKSRAQAGQILVSEMVKSILGSTVEVEFRDKGRFALKGFSERWRLFEVAWSKNGDARAILAPARTAFVGRTAERAMLSEALEQARLGVGSLVLIGGEAGVGKTRLTEELIAEARGKGMFTGLGRCYDMEGPPPYLPFVEVVDYFARVAPEANFRAALGDAAPEVARLAPRIRRLIPDLGEPLSLPPEQARHLMFESFVDFVARGAAIQPLLVVLEDLHWADDSSCLLLEHVAHRLPEMAVLVLATYRDVELSPEMPLSRGLERLGRGRVGRRLSLARFGQNDVQAMLQALGGKKPPDGLVKVIFDETEGVPYFIEEVFRHLLEEGRLFDERGEWRSDVQFGEVEVPESVRLVIGRRLERVSEATRQVLVQAAALGKDFTYPFLARLAGGDEDELLDAIEEAERAHLLQSNEGKNPRFMFGHEQIRQTLLGGLSFPRRQRLHLRVADTIEEMYSDSLDEHLADLAYHLSHARESSRAIHYLKQAGERAAEGYASREALDYFDRALDLEPDAESRTRILERRGKLLLGLFRGREAVPDLEELLAQSRQHGDIGRQIDNLLDLGAAYWNVALDEPTALANSRDALDEAYELARSLGDKVRMARARLATIWFPNFWPDYASTARANTEEAFALSQEAGDADLILEARRARLQMMPPEAITAEAEELRSEFEVRRSLVQLNDLLFFLMWHYYGQGNFAACVQACDEGTLLARRIGAEPVQYASIRGSALTDLGRFGDAWESFQKEIADENHPFGRAHRDAGIAAYYAELEAYERAAAAARDVIAQARAVGRPWIENWGGQTLAMALVWMGEVRGRSSEAVRASIQSLGGHPRDDIVAEALLVAGAPQAAMEPVEKYVRSSHSRGRLRDYIPALELKARILTAGDRPQEALAVLEEALAMAQEMDYGRVLWRLHYAIGNAHTALHDEEQARAAYDKAGAALREIAATVPDPALRKAFLNSNPARAVLGSSRGQN
jgi:class 3 adenylate cyclase/tetratricopeptide (TPR) repeat protein